MVSLNLYKNTYHHIPKDYIVIECAELTSIVTPEEFDIVCQQIIDYYTSNNAKGILFNLISEGLMYNYINPAQIICRRLVEEFQLLSLNQSLLLSSGLVTNKNIQCYKDACKRFNWYPIPISFMNWWEITRNHNQEIQKEFYNHIDISPRIKNKKFVCYNGSVKMHRLFITAEIIKANLYDQCYLSNYFDYKKDAFMLGHAHEDLPNLHLSLKEFINNNKNIFPLDLGLLSEKDETHGTRSHGVVDSDLPHYNDTYFSVVTESKFFHDNEYNLQRELSLNCYFLTEKTYKFIHGKKPFILAAMPGSLEVLQQQGYKTFHPFIDESYDSIENDEARLLAIVAEIKRLTSLTDDQWLEWQRNIEPILLHNHANLFAAGTKILSYFP